MKKALVRLFGLRLLVPALAFADVGVSLGGRQTDIAAESSAVTIHSEGPNRLMEAPFRSGKCS